MRIWLDDERAMPQGFDIHLRTAAEAIALLAKGGISLISLDHDLGDGGGTGYEVACYIEQAAFEGTLPPLEVAIHSANPVGRERMQQAVHNAFKHWDAHTHQKGRTSAAIARFFTASSWIEGESIRQLERVAALPGMRKVAAFPDLHPGKGGPVGAAMLSEGIFYPYLVGSDAGCGMSFFDTDSDASEVKPEKLAKKLKGLEEPWDGDTTAQLKVFDALPGGYEASLGTIGMGNHFAELLKVKEMFDESYFRFCGLKPHNLFVLLHSGSRGLGEKLLRSHVDVHRDGGLIAGSEEARQYLAAHDNCLKWARSNRDLIAWRLIEQIDRNPGIGHAGNWCHNSITVVTYEGRDCFLHRKGAAPTDGHDPFVIIPGSRGTCTYLVKPLLDDATHLWSLAHGAGRKWGRNECAGRLREKYSAESMKKTRLGSYVICEDKSLLFEEAPQAYKDIDAVIADMVSFGLIEVIATFTPVLTYKVRGRGGQR